jgi:hypothetical protein
MKNLIAKSLKLKFVATTGCLVFFCLKGLPVFSQVQSVTTLQNLCFGAFAQGSNGGTITISTNGSRNATGSVIPLNTGSFPAQAIFGVEAPEGTIISILNGPDVNLTGSNGGTMSLHIETADPLSPFISSVAPPGKIIVNLGGTLTVGDAFTSPPGSYSGTFYITFNNE